MQETLALLKDVHMPQSPSFWPPSLNLSLSVIVFLVCIIFFAVWFSRYLKRSLFKKEAFMELERINKAYVLNQDRAFVQNSVSILLKRIEKSSNQKNNQKIFPKKILLSIQEILQKDRFKKDPNISVNELLKLMKELIKKCRI